MTATSPSLGDSRAHGDIRVVEFDMMDKRLYFPLTAGSGFIIRGIVYPVSLIKTRLQIQKSLSMYNGTIDAFVKIYRHEGMHGLYRGFWVQSLIMVPSLVYITSYESLRRHLAVGCHIHDTKLRSFIAGGIASCLGQTLTVPIDIVGQHLMLLGSTSSKQRDPNQQQLSKLQTIRLTDNARHSRFGAIVAICQMIYKRDRLYGFYRGYFMSLMVFVPNSAMWWLFYDLYSDILTSVSPTWIPRLALLCVAAPLGGCSAALLSNPIDLVRARMQVDGTKFRDTIQRLWHEERMWLVLKGLSARLVQSMTFSFLIVLGYETVKRCSLTDEYKESVRW